MENIIEKEQELYGITLYNAKNEVIYNIAMPPLKLGDEIKDYENKFSVLLPDAKVQNYRKIMHNIYKMQDTWTKYKKYFAEKDRTILTDSSTTILNFIRNDKYHTKNITNQLK